MVCSEITARYRAHTNVQLLVFSCMPAACCQSCVTAVQEKVEAEPTPPTAALADALDHAVLLAQQAGQVQRACGLDVLPDDYVRSTLRFGLTEVTLVLNNLKVAVQGQAAMHGTAGVTAKRAPFMNSS